MENSKILFRCSRIGELMSEPKTTNELLYYLNGIEITKQKAAKLIADNKIAGLTTAKVQKTEAGFDLSDTAKTYVESVWMQNTYGYKEDIVTDDMLKGLLSEQDSMQLFQDYLKSGLILKNTENLKNDYITGTPDIIGSEYVDDLKTSSNLRTFFEAEPTKNNIWQIKGYMRLTRKKKGRVIYCLVPTPEELITEHKKRYWFKFGCNDDNPHYMEISEQIEHNNNVILQIPIEKRIKIFEFTYDEDEIIKLYAQIEKARIYYNGLHL